MLDALKADLAKSVLKHSEGSNSLATMKKVKLAQWCIPIMAAAWKTEAGGSLEPSLKQPELHC
jgi:hypothetical protein